VNVTDGLATASETFKVSVTNSAPVLTRIGDQTMLISQSTLQLPLNVRDPDGDALALSAQAMAIDPLAQKAYNLDQQLGLHTYPDGNYYYNIRAAGEKYMLGNDGMYFILPNGGLYRWGGSIAASTLVDTLSPAYHANPALLHDAQQPSLTSLADNGVAVSLTNNVLLINRDFGYVNDFFVRVSASDGISTASETFRVSTTSSASLKSAAFESAIPMVAEMTTDHGNDSATTSFNTALAWLACTGGEGPGYGRHDLSGGANDWTSGADIPVCQPASAPISGRSALLDAVFARLSSLDSAPDATQSSPTALDRQLREVFSSRLAETPLILAGRLSLEIDDNSSAGEPFAGEEKSPVFGPRSWDSIEQDALDLVFDSLSECRESLGPRLL
jgi:hypothetical protein